MVPRWGRCIFEMPVDDTDNTWERIRLRRSGECALARGVVGAGAPPCAAE